MNQKVTPRRKRTVVRAIAAVVVAAVIGLVLWAIFKPSPPAPGLPVVEVEPVQAGNVNIYGEYIVNIYLNKFKFILQMLLWNLIQLKVLLSL